MGMVSLKRVKCVKKKVDIFTVCDKIDNLLKVDTHSGMYGDLALELCTGNETEKL
jgi:hypothetical protein